MKRVFFGIALLLCIVGCSKQTQPNNSALQPSNDVYYVKYVFSCKVVQYGKVYSIPYSVTFTNSGLTEDTRNYKTADEQELTCGPFKIRDKVKLSLQHSYEDNVGGSSQAQTQLDVYVSKNNSPFSLQKSESAVSQKPQTTVLEYIIN